MVHLTNRERFYRERDVRTVDYLGSPWPVDRVIFVEAGDDACSSPAGQLALLTLINQLARFFRDIRVAASDPDAPILVPPVCSGENLGDEMLRLTRRIDPFGHFRIDTKPGSGPVISIGIGQDCRNSLDWYLGFNKCTAELTTFPAPLGRGRTSDLRGAGVAALLGASAAIKTLLGIPVVPRTLSSWNFQEGKEADPGPDELPIIDVGRTLMVGAGAVGSGVVYWLMQWGKEGPWTIVDPDPIELHNTNRCVLFFPDDAGWPDGPAERKSKCLTHCISDTRHINKWYSDAPETLEDFDTVLVLANEHNVRTQMSHRNDPIQFQATTSPTWLAQLHRHIVGIDGCVHCRMEGVHALDLKCGEGATATDDYPKRPDAALPFLSLASGLMLVSALQHLQAGDIGASRMNTWDWDFKSAHQMADCGFSPCHDSCSIVLPPEARREVSNVTRWHDQCWLQFIHRTTQSNT